MRRPILFDVDVSARPARMTLCFVGRPHRFISVRIRRELSNAPTLDEARIAAFSEIDGFTEEQRQLLAESAVAAPVAPDPPQAIATLEQVEHEDRFPGLLHCPACCAKLGHGTSPSIGYLEECPTCKRRLVVRFVPGAVTIVLWPGDK
jgi:hypothetical protein